MHFLGLAGMPRRIPDYPDAYAGFNLIASYGSFISVFSTLLFFIVLYITLTTNNRFTNFKSNWKLDDTLILGAAPILSDSKISEVEKLTSEDQTLVVDTIPAPQT